MLKRFARSLFFIIAFILFKPSLVLAQPLPIKVEGDISEEDKPVAAVAIQVVCNGKVATTALSDAKGEYAFQLPQGKDYYIVFTKEGYVAKRFTVSTRNIPKELESSEFSTLTARVVLFKKMNGIDYSLLDQPMVKYYFNTVKKEFDYDMGYLNQMLAKLETIKEAERAMREKEQGAEAAYHNIVKAADKSFERKEYQDALNKYQEALAMKPKEIHPQTQITLCNKLIADQELLKKEQADRLAKDKAEADAARARAEADRLAKEKADADAKAKADADAKARAEADAARAKAEADRLLREKIEKELVSKAEADRISKEKAEAEAKAKAEADRLAKEKADADAKAKADLEAKMKAEADRVAKEKADADAKAKADAERLAKELKEKEAKNKIEADKLAKEKAALDAAKAKEKADEAKAKAEEEKLIKEFLEKEAKAKAEEEKIAKAKAAEDAAKLKAEEARIAKENAEAARKAKEKATQDSIKAKLEADRIAKEKAEADRLAKQQAAAEAAKAKAEADRIAKEIADAEAKTKAEADRKAKEQAAAEALKAKIEADRLAKEKAEADAKAKAEADRIAKEKAIDEAAKLKAEAEAKIKAAAEQDKLSKQNDAAYKAAIAKGDELFKTKKYREAELQYQTALTVKGGDPYAKERLMECERLISSDANQKTDERQKQLLAKYPEGVTEEIVSADGVIIIKRILVKSKVAYVYEKKVFNWGGIACFRDGAPIPETVFEHDTQKN